MRGTQTPHRNDLVHTPDALAREIVLWAKPWGSILEPCRGGGAFMRCLPDDTEWCEIEDGRDFYGWAEPVDWIVTNPPWTQFRPFLIHALEVADNVVFLAPLVHWWSTARLRLIHEAGFGFVKLKRLEYPKSFPKLGFALGVGHIKRGHTGPCEMDLG